MIKGATPFSGKRTLRTHEPQPYEAIQIAVKPYKSLTKEL